MNQLMGPPDDNNRDHQDGERDQGLRSHGVFLLGKLDMAGADAPATGRPVLHHEAYQRGHLSRIAQKDHATPMC